MKNLPLNRLAAILLVPCLIADPALAAASHNTPVHQAFVAADVELFNREALAGQSAEFIRAIAHYPIAKLALIQLAALALQSAASHYGHHDWGLLFTGLATVASLTSKSSTPALPKVLVDLTREIDAGDSLKGERYGHVRRLNWTKLTLEEKRAALEALAIQKVRQSQGSAKAAKLQSDTNLLHQAVINLGTRDLRKPVEGLGTSLEIASEYYAEQNRTLREKGVIKTIRWLMLEDLGYIPNNLPSIEQLRTSQDLLLLLEKGALDEILWGLLWTWNPDLCCSWLLEIAGHAFPGQIKPGMSAEELRSVLLKLQKRNFESEFLPSLEGRDAKGLYEFASSRERGSGTAVRFIVDTLFPPAQTVPIRSFRQLYILEALRVLRDEGMLLLNRTQGIWDEETGMPNSGRRALLHEAAVEAKQPLDDGALSYKKYGKLTVPSFGRNLEGLFSRYAGTHPELAHGFVVDALVSDIGFLKTEAALKQALMTWKVGYEMFHNASQNSASPRIAIFTLAQKLRSRLKTVERNPDELRPILDQGMLAVDAALKSTDSSHAAERQSLLIWKQSLEAYWQILDTAQWMPATFYSIYLGMHARLATFTGIPIDEFLEFGFIKRSMGTNTTPESRIIALLKLYQKPPINDSKTRFWELALASIRDYPDPAALRQMLLDSNDPDIRELFRRRNHAGENLLAYLRRPRQTDRELDAQMRAPATMNRIDNGPSMPSTLAWLWEIWHLEDIQNNVMVRGPRETRYLGWFVLGLASIFIHFGMASATVVEFAAGVGALWGFLHIAGTYLLRVGENGQTTIERSQWNRDWRDLLRVSFGKAMGGAAWLATATVGAVLLLGPHLIHLDWSTWIIMPVYVLGVSRMAERFHRSENSSWFHKAAWEIALKVAHSAKTEVSEIISTGLAALSNFALAERLTDPRPTWEIGHPLRALEVREGTAWEEVAANALQNNRLYRLSNDAAQSFSRYYRITQVTEQNPDGRLVVPDQWEADRYVLLKNAAGKLQIMPEDHWLQIYEFKSQTPPQATASDREKQIYEKVQYALRILGKTTAELPSDFNFEVRKSHDYPEEVDIWGEPPVVILHERVFENEVEFTSAMTYAVNHLIRRREHLAGTLSDADADRDALQALISDVGLEALYPLHLVHKESLELSRRIVYVVERWRVLRHHPPKDQQISFLRNDSISFGYEVITQLEFLLGGFKAMEEYQQLPNKRVPHPLKIGETIDRLTQPVPSAAGVPGNRSALEMLRALPRRLQELIATGDLTSAEQLVIQAQETFVAHFREPSVAKGVQILTVACNKLIAVLLGRRASGADRALLLYEKMLSILESPSIRHLPSTKQLRALLTEYGAEILAAQRTNTQSTMEPGVENTETPNLAERVHRREHYIYDRHRRENQKLEQKYLNSHPAPSLNQGTDLGSPLFPGVSLAELRDESISHNSHARTFVDILEHLQRNEQGRQLGITPETILAARMLNIGFQSDRDDRPMTDNLVSFLRPHKIDIVGLDRQTESNPEHGSVNGDIFNLPAPFGENAFDAVIVIGLLEPDYFIGDQSPEAAQQTYGRALAGISQVLRSGGALLVDAYGPNADLLETAKERGMETIDLGSDYYLFINRKDLTQSATTVSPVGAMGKGEIAGLEILPATQAQMGDGNVQVHFRQGYTGPEIDVRIPFAFTAAGPGQSTGKSTVLTGIRADLSSHTERLEKESPELSRIILNALRWFEKDFHGTLGVLGYDPTVKGIGHPDFIGVGERFQNNSAAWLHEILEAYLISKGDTISLDESYVKERLTPAAYEWFKTHDQAPAPISAKRHYFIRAITKGALPSQDDQLTWLIKNDAPTTDILTASPITDVRDAMHALSGDERKIIWLIMMIGKRPDFPVEYYLSSFLAAYFAHVEQSIRRHAEQVKRSMASSGVRSEATLVSS